MAIVAEELAGCLRSWRERVAPVDAGLPAGSQRRVPGLRREEVARLAGVSVDYPSGGGGGPQPAGSAQQRA